MVLKLKHHTQGNHVHVTAFIGEDEHHLARSGSLVVRTGEWDFLKVLLAAGPLQREGRVLIYEDGETGRIDRRVA